MAASRVIDNFAGGANYGDAEKIAIAEAAVLEHFIHTDGNLRSFDGRVLYNSTEIEQGGTVYGLWRKRINGTSYTIAQMTTDILLDCGDVTPKFRPIVDMGLNTAPGEPVVWDKYLYLTGSATPMRRWDGFYYVTGTAACAGSTTAVTGAGGAAWTTGAVRKGDSIWFRVSSAWDGPYYIATIGGETSITLGANGPNTGGAVTYIISRQHYAGIDPPGGTITATAVGSGGSIAAGDYQYAVTLYNSVTGVESNPQYVTGTVTCVASDSVTIAAFTTSYNTWGSRLQADQMRIYRTKGFGGTYYLAKTVDRDQAGYAFAASYTDDVADSSLGAELATGHDLPPLGGRLTLWNNRLYAWDIDSYWSSTATYTAVNGDNWMFFSSQDYPEYWPTNDYGQDDPFDISVQAGGYVRVGDSSTAIMGVVSEQGTSAGIGTEGENLLILPESGLAYRWFGRDWSNFSLQQAFATSCVSKRVALNADGRLLWVANEGPVLLMPGTNQPLPIYEKLFPTASRKLQDKVTAASGSNWYKQQMFAVAWNNWYIVTWPETTSTSNNRGFLYHMPSNTFTTLDNTTNALNARCMATWDGPADNNKLYYGQDGSGYIWELFAKTSTNTYWTPATTTGVACKYTSPILYGNPEVPEEFHRVKAIRNVWIVCQKPTADQTLTLTVLVNGATSGTAIGNTLSATGDGRRWLRYCPNVHGHCFQIQLTGTFTAQVTIERIIIEYERTSGDVTA